MAITTCLLMLINKFEASKYILYGVGNVYFIALQSSE